MRSDERCGSDSVIRRCRLDVRFAVQHRRDQVTVEFGGNPQAMADEILRLRYILVQFAEAINWMKLGAPFVMLLPGTGN